MDFKELVLKNRSYRRFDASRPVEHALLVNLVDLARQTASASNRQPLRYILSSTPEKNKKILACLGWAGSLPDWPGPEEDEQPTGYIVVLQDKELRSPWGSVDAGIAIQTMLLGAVEQGLGGVMFGNVKKDLLRENLSISADYEIFLVVAIGYPVETIVLEDMEPGASHKYYREPDMTHHVPKRTLNDVIIH